MGNARQGSQQGAGLQARAVGIWAPPWWEQRKAARRRRDGARGTWGPGAWLDRRMKAGLPGASQREAGRARPGDCLGACCLFLVDPESYQGKDQRSWQSLTTLCVCADSWRGWGRAGGVRVLGLHMVWLLSSCLFLAGWDGGQRLEPGMEGWRDGGGAGTRP